MWWQLHAWDLLPRTLPKFSTLGPPVEGGIFSIILPSLPFVSDIVWIYINQMVWGGFRGIFNIKMSFISMSMTSKLNLVLVSLTTKLTIFVFSQNNENSIQTFVQLKTKWKSWSYTKKEIHPCVIPSLKHYKKSSRVCPSSIRFY